MSLKTFTDAYIEAMLFSTNDESDPSGGVPLDQNYGPGDIARDTMIVIKADCAEFYEKYEPVWNGRYVGRSQALEDANAGHDFWLTREGHGAGFWDGDWDDTVDNELSEAAKSYGEFPLEVYRGKVHGMSVPRKKRGSRKPKKNTKKRTSRKAR